MAGFTLVSTQTIIARNAGALYGLEVGNSNMTSYVSQVGSNVDAFLNTVYTNSVGTASTASVAAVLVANLGLTGAAATEGTNYIVAQLNAVAYTARGAVVNNILTAFSNLTSDATYGAAATAWNTKVANAVSYAAVAGNQDAAFDTVSSSPIGQTFTLTTGADVSASFAGGAGSDSYYGAIGGDGTAANGTTLNAGDNFDGGAGANKLNISLSGTNTAAQTTASFTAKNIQSIEVANFETSAFNSTIDLAQATSVNAITVTSSSATGDTEFSSIAGLVSAAVKNGAGDLTLTYATTVVAGSADTQALTVSGQTGGTFTANGIETIAVKSDTATNTLTLAGDALKTITVAGDKGLALGTLAATVTKVDGSGLTAGSLTATGNTAVNYSLVGGAGDDTFTVSTGFDTSDTIDGGAGNDTLSIATAITAATGLAKVSNVETLKVTGANGVTLAANVSATTFDFSDSADEILTLNAGYTAATTVKLTGDSTNADKIVNSANVALTVNANIADIDAGTTITGGSGTDTLNLKADGDTSTLTATSGVEKIVVLAGTTVTSTATIAMGAVDTLIAAGKTLTVDASALTDTAAVFTFTGSTSETDGYLNVTGGAGNDVISGTASGYDTLDGGAGNDAITLATLAATNVVKGGAGTDTLAVTTDIAAATVFAGVSGVETLILGNLTDLTLAANIASTTGIATIDASDSSDNIITLNTGYTDATTVKLTGDSTNADKIVNSANVALTVNANDEDIDAATTITGGTGVDTINLTAKAGTATITKITGVETIKVLAGASLGTGSTITMGANDTQITAAKTLTIDATAIVDATAVFTFNGTTSETDGYLNVTGGAGNDVISGGASGFDTLDGGAGNDAISLATLAVTNVVKGGAGTDSLAVTTDIAAASSFMGVTGVETLILGNLTDLTLAANIAATTGITTIDASDSSDNIITLNAGYTDATTVKLTGDSTNADKIVNSANVALTVNANSADIDSGTTITGGTGTDVINLRADSDAGGADLTATSGIEKIVLVVGSTASATAKITMGAVNTQIAAGKTLTVDASALTNSSAAVTFVGTTSENDGSVVFIGGAGADAFTGGGYLDTITGGAGADTITFAAQANKLSYDTFTDAATGDILNTADKGTETFTSAKITLGGAATFGDYLDAAAAGNGGTNGIFSWFNYGSNTYVVYDVSAGGTFVGGTDAVIELTGVKSLTNSTVGDHILTLAVA